MKKNIVIIIAAVIFVFSATSCNNESRTDTDNADTVSAETTVPAGAPVNGLDTTTTAPVDPAMDTSANQTPKM
jgi:hypothetical protein